MVGTKLKNNFSLKKLFFSFFIFFLLFSLPKFVWANVTINNDLDIKKDTIWNKDQGQYLISGDISIEKGVTLKIEAGTEIQFQNNRAIYLFGGNLDIEGGESEKVSIDTILGKHWNLYNFGGKMNINDAIFSDLFSIYVNTQGYVDIKSSDISSIYALDLFDSSFLSIDGGSLSASKDSAIYATDSSKVYLSSTEISSLCSYETISINQGSDLHMNSVVMDYSIGSKSLLINDGTVDILGSQFEGGLKDGIVIYQGDSSLNIAYSSILNFKDSAVKNYYANVSIKESDFFGNGTAFTFYPTTTGKFTASKNNIEGNTSGVYFSTYMNITDNFDVRNNFWGDASGPYDKGNNSNPTSPSKGNPNGQGDSVSGFANIISNYTPWLTTPASHVIHNPVIIIPGILSSYLDKADGTEVWPNLSKALVPGSDTYLDDLILSPDGKTSSTTINTPDIMRETKIPLLFDVDFFQGLITKLKEQYAEGEDLFVFPYDWRLDVDSVAQEKLSLFVENILEQTGSEKVDIVAHSMGGLVTKSYIKNFGADKIGKFIDIATPHLGSPDSLKILSYGDDLGVNFLGILGLNSEEVKKISQNFPSVYELLPSEKYFDSIDSDYKYYFDDLGDTDKNGVKGRLNFSETMDFLKNSGRNSTLIDEAKEFQEGIADVDPETNGIETINIVGCGTPTIGKIYTLDKKNSKNEYALGYINGDGTVPLQSAEALNAEKTYYISGGIAHGTMPSSQGVKDLISSILFGKDVITDKNVNTTKSNCKLPNGKYVSVHSPIKIDVYDQVGNHTGPNASGDIEQNIPGVIYDTIEDNKFVFVPDDENYKINLQATDLGSFSIDIKTEKDDVDHFDYFNDIPINNVSLSGSIDLSSSTPTLVIKKDVGSDNTTLLPDVSSDVDLYEQGKDVQTQNISSEVSLPPVLNSAKHHSGSIHNSNLPILVTKTITISVLTPNSYPAKILTSAKMKDTKIFAQNEPKVFEKNMTNDTKESNFAGALGAFRKLSRWSFFEKLLNYKNNTWNFFTKIFHLTK